MKGPMRKYFIFDNVGGLVCQSSTSKNEHSEKSQWPRE